MSLCDATTPHLPHGTWRDSPHRFDRIFTRDGDDVRFVHRGASVVRYGGAVPFRSDHLPVHASLGLQRA
ncbi:MAG: hypothetical protein AB2A00_23775 [Myxococcota bacterium]